MATLSTLRPRVSLQRRTRLPRLSSFAHLWHLASLDAPTVAVVWTQAFAWIARVQLPLWLPTVLALTAWSVYIGDRLLDARNARTPLRERHHFHWQHRRVFLPIAIAAGLTAFALVIVSMPPAARERNSVLAAAALVYFASIHSPWRLPASRVGLKIPKELLVGVLFTLACLTPTWARVPGQRLELLLPALCFFTLAWLNCHAIETWESGTRTQALTIFRLGMGLTTLSLLCAAAVGKHDLRQALLLAAGALSAAFLALADLQRPKMAPVTLRAFADLVLLTPAVLLVIR